MNNVTTQLKQKKVNVMKYAEYIKAMNTLERLVEHANKKTILSACSLNENLRRQRIAKEIGKALTILRSQIFEVEDITQ